MKSVTSPAFATLIILAFILSACASNSPAPSADGQPDAPSPAEPSVEEAVDSSMLYAEDFEDGTSCFAEDQLESASLSLENGELVMEVQAAGESLWSTCDEVQLKDFRMEMDIFDDTASEGFHYFGVNFRSEPVDDESNQWYEVTFGLGEGFVPAFCSGLGTEATFEGFTESIYDDSCWVDLPERIESGQWHHFEISADGPVLTFSVNDTFVASLNDPRIEQGTFGLIAGTFDGESARIKIDNIQITDLSN